MQIIYRIIISHTRTKFQTTESKKRQISPRPEAGNSIRPNHGVTKIDIASWQQEQDALRKGE